MNLRIYDKLKILAEAAKYDVSCASSGSKRKNTNGFGNSNGMGICHSYTEDGRCVSLLKILLTNFCIYDCAYCVSRKSNDIERVAFTVDEVVELTVSFYRRNYIEGLFLSSGIFKNADYTNERLVRIAKKLREEHNFNGYIHLKIIPGCSDEMISDAGKYADRLSVNLEIPTEKHLKKVAPEKNHSTVYKPMNFLAEKISEVKEERKRYRKTPLFAPAGQSTQMIVGATAETDLEILRLSSDLYKKQRLKRVYYSGYIPVSDDERLPALKTPPLVRENRLYQADWLFRFYGFATEEIIPDSQPFLDPDIDPKMSWALRNLDLFPVDINTADYSMILRVPGIGIKTANMIIKARKHSLIRFDDIRKMGAAMNRAKHFIQVPGRSLLPSYSTDKMRMLITQPSNQMTLFS